RQARGLVVERVLGGVTDQPARAAHLVHHLVAGVDAGRAGDALDLQALADIDAGGTHLHAPGAVDAVAETLRARIRAALAGATRLTAFLVVGDDQRVLVEHGALEARVGTHVLAYLLAQVAGVSIGGEAVEEHPEGFPGSERQRQHLVRQHADRRE